MHRAIGMRRLGPRAGLFPPSRHALRIVEDYHLRRNLSHIGQAAPSRAASPGIARPHGTTPAMTAISIPPGMHPGKMSLSSTVRSSRRWISSSTPLLKGRRGGASALVQRPSRSKKKPPKDKKPRAMKAKYGERFAQPQAKDRSPSDIPASGLMSNTNSAAPHPEQGPDDIMERLAKITPEESKKLQKLADDFLDISLGDQELGENQFLLKQDSDAMMRELGISTDESEPFKKRALSGGWAERWRKIPVEKVLPAAENALPVATAQATLHEGEKEAASPKVGGAEVAPELYAHSGYDAAAAADSTVDGVARTKYPSGMRDLKQEANFAHLIRVLNAQGRFQEARLRIIPEMERRGVRMNTVHYTVLFSGAAMEKDPRAAEQLWADMLSKGVKPNEYTYESRIHAHCSAGWMHSAFKIGDEMREAGFPWTVMTYTTMISGCNRKRYYKRAWETYKDMVINGVQPDVMTYTAIMKMCADTYQYERAMKFCREMEEMDGIQPTLGTIETLVRAAAKAPQWIQAYGDIVDDLVIKMKGLGLKPREQTYRTFMFAYGNGGDADRVLQCIEEIHELTGHDVEHAGDGAPKLSPQSYCAALNALASCMSAGFHGGTRPRWGCLPHQQVPKLDITPLPVLRSDAEQLKTLKSHAITWDEDAEMSLRKGQKRVKFRGVDTPEDLRDDDEWERTVEEEHRRVMQKAKAEKKQREREEQLSLGINPDEDYSHMRPCLFPDPAGKDNMRENMPAWLRGGPDAPGLPDAPGIPPELLFGDPAMEEEHQRRKKLEEMSGGGGEEMMLGAGGDGVSWFEEQERNDMHGGAVPLLLQDNPLDALDALDEEDGEGAKRSEEESKQGSAEMKKEEKDEDEDREWVEGDGRLVAGESGLRMPAYLDLVVKNMRKTAQEEQDKRKAHHRHLRDGDGDDEDHDNDELKGRDTGDVAAEMDGELLSGARFDGTRKRDNNVSVGGTKARDRHVRGTRGEDRTNASSASRSLDSAFSPQSLDGLLSSSLKNTGAGGGEGDVSAAAEDIFYDSDWEGDIPEDIGERVGGVSALDGQPMSLVDSGSGGAAVGQPLGKSLREERRDDEEDEIDDEESMEDKLIRMLSEEAMQSGDTGPPTAERAEAMLDKMLEEAEAAEAAALAADGDDNLLDVDSGATDDLQHSAGGDNHFDGDGDYDDDGRPGQPLSPWETMSFPQAPEGVLNGGADGSLDRVAQQAFDDMVMGALGEGRGDGGAAGGQTSRIVELKDGEDWGLEEREDGGLEKKPWDRLMHKSFKERNYALLQTNGKLRSKLIRNSEQQAAYRDISWWNVHDVNYIFRCSTVRKLEKDAMVAARNADRAAGYSGEGECGPAMEAVMRARLRCMTEDRSTGRAMRFIEEEYPAQGAPFRIQAAHAVVDMYCRIGGPSLYKAVAFEERCRKEFGLKPNRRLLGTLLESWSKRRNRQEMTKTLDLMQELGVPCREKDLTFCRVMVDKGTFDHKWLPLDPRANEKKMLAAVKKTRMPDTRVTRQVVSQIMKSKFIGANRRF